jgi:hypothetical protein
VVLGPAEQLTFDGIESAAPDPAAKPASITWSYSRRGVLEQCPLRYYYEYYGSNSRTAKAEPRKERLRFLKRLSNRHLRTGDIAHFVIRAYLRGLKGNEEWSVDRVVGWAREVYRCDLEFSRGYRLGEALPSGLRAPVLLSEFYYGMPNAIELWEESEARLVAALTNFVRSPKLEPFRMGGGRPDALIETRFNLKQERFSAVGMMDLAYPEDGRVAVVDWKMGEGSDDVLQLYSYALEAVRRFGCGLSDLTLYRVSLVDDEVSSFVIGEREALRAEVRMLQDLETMEGLDRYGREAVAAAFTPCGQSRVCTLCPFQEFCPKE